MSIDTISPDAERALRGALHRAAGSVEVPADSRHRISGARYRVRDRRPALATSLLAAAVVTGAVTAAALDQGGTPRHAKLEGARVPRLVDAQLVADVTHAVSAESGDIERVVTITPGADGSTTQLVSPDGRTIRVTTATAAGPKTDELISPQGEVFVDYVNKQWWESSSVPSVDDAPAPTADPAAVPSLLRAGELVRTDDTATVGGVADAFEIKSAAGGGPPVTIWIDPSTFLPLRIVTGGEQRDVTWLDPATNLDQLRLEPPAGFTRVSPPTGTEAVTPNG